MNDFRSTSTAQPRRAPDERRADAAATPSTAGAAEDLRIVITHDFAELYGGAERVTAEIAIAFPDAPVWMIAGRASVAERMGILERSRSLIPPRQKLLDHYRLLTPTLPALVRATRLPAADVLISSSYAFAHHFRTRNGAPQVCYCHSPLRFAWTMQDDYERTWARGSVRRLAFSGLAAAMRRSDRRASGKVGAYLTQSPYTAEQIERFYGRPAEVIGAPVDCEKFRPAATAPGDYFLLCGRLVEPYKKVGLTIEAFRRLGLPLVIAGAGPDMAALRATAPPNVTFTGHLDDADLVPLIQRCRALVFPSRDDFGLLPVEAMACGRPVVAYDGGGARYTVVPGVTGERFPEQTVDALVAAIESFDPARYDPQRIRRHAEQWDRARFRARLQAAVAQLADGR